MEGRARGSAGVRGRAPRPVSAPRRRPLWPCTQRAAPRATADHFLGRTLPAAGPGPTAPSYPRRDSICQHLSAAPRDVPQAGSRARSLTAGALAAPECARPPRAARLFAPPPPLLVTTHTPLHSTAPPAPCPLPAAAVKRGPRLPSHHTPHRMQNPRQALGPNPRAEPSPPLAPQDSRSGSFAPRPSRAARVLSPMDDPRRAARPPGHQAFCPHTRPPAHRRIQAHTGTHSTAPLGPACHPGPLLSQLIGRRGRPETRRPCPPPLALNLRARPRGVGRSALMRPPQEPGSPQFWHSLHISAPILQM